MIRYYFKSLIYLFCRWIIHKDYMTASVPQFGLQFKFKTEDVAGRIIYKGRIYEADLTSFLLENLPLAENDVLFDVGANMGWYSILLSKRAPASVKIHAFEPDPVNFSLLEHNVSINKAHQVVINKEAVSNTEDTKILYQYPSKNQGRHSLLPINAGTQVEVRTTSLDHYIKEHHIEAEKIKFIKIDIEGYEYFAFKGAQQALAHTPYILAEYSPHYMKKGGVAHEDLLNLLYGFAFIPHLITEGRLVEISREDILAQDHNVNLFWKKKGFEL